MDLNTLFTLGEAIDDLTDAIGRTNDSQCSPNEVIELLSGRLISEENAKRLMEYFGE